MADTNEVTIRRTNVGWGYEVFIGDVRLQHIKDLSMRLTSTTLAEFTITFMAKLSHGAGLEDQSDGLHGAATSAMDVAYDDDLGDDPDQH